MNSCDIYNVQCTIRSLSPMKKKLYWIQTNTKVWAPYPSGRNESELTDIKHMHGFFPAVTLWQLCDINSLYILEFLYCQSITVVNWSIDRNHYFAGSLAGKMDGARSFIWSSLYNSKRCVSTIDYYTISIGIL